MGNSEILHSCFTVFRRDLHRSFRGGGRVLIAVKTASFKGVKEFKLESEADSSPVVFIQTAAKGSAHKAGRGGYRQREHKVRWEGRKRDQPLLAHLTLPFAAGCMKTTGDESESEPELQQFEIIFAVITILT